MSDRVPKLWVEGAVIVASILLAFSIDAAWDSQRSRGEVDALVELLREDISQNIARLEVAQATVDDNVRRLTALLVLMEGGVSFPPQDSVLTLIGATMTNSPFQPITAAYDAAVGSEAWRAIPPNTKVLLADFVGAANLNRAGFAGDFIS